MRQRHGQLRQTTQKTTLLSEPRKFWNSHYPQNFADDINYSFFPTKICTNRKWTQSALISLVSLHLYAIHLFPISLTPPLDVVLRLQGQIEQSQKLWLLVGQIQIQVHYRLYLYLSQVLADKERWAGHSVEQST